MNNQTLLNIGNGERHQPPLDMSISSFSLFGECKDTEMFIEPSSLNRSIGNCINEKLEK